MHLIVGLRNPGSDYEGTRHNIGFDVLRRVLDRRGLKLGRAPLKVHGQVAKTGAGEDRVFYFASNRFMNETGESIRAAALYYKVVAEQMLIVHDDIDLAFGRLRLQVGGGSGGHNGIRSVERALRTRDFSRLKVGVGRPPGSLDPAEYVLRRFTKAEQADVGSVIEAAADVVERWPEAPARAQEMAALFGDPDG